MQCNAALCMCIVSLQCTTDERKKGERDKKERRKKYRTKGTQNAEEKKKFDEKRNTMVCECVLVCSWLHTNNDDLKKNICSQSSNNIFFSSIVVSFRLGFFFFEQQTKISFAWASTLLNCQPICILKWKRSLKKYATKLHNNRTYFFFWPNERKLHAVHSPSKWNCIHSEHDSHLEMFIVGYLPKAHGYFENCLCKNDHRFTHNTPFEWYKTKVAHFNVAGERARKKLSFRKVFELEQFRVQWLQMHAQNLCHSTFAAKKSNINEMMKYLSIWIMKLLTFDECHNAEPNMPKNYWYIKKRAQQKRVRKRKTYTNRPFHFYVSKQFIKTERSTIVSITRFHSLDMVTVYIADWSICSDLSLHWLRFVIAVHWSCLLVNVACNDLELSDSSVTIIFHNTVLWAELGISLNFPHINFLPSNFDRLRFHFENKKKRFPLLWYP